MHSLALFFKTNMKHNQIQQRTRDQEKKKHLLLTSFFQQVVSINFLKLFDFLSLFWAFLVLSTDIFFLYI